MKRSMRAVAISAAVCTLLPVAAIAQTAAAATPSQSPQWSNYASGAYNRSFFAPLVDRKLTPQQLHQLEQYLAQGIAKNLKLTDDPAPAPTPTPAPAAPKPADDGGAKAGSPLNFSSYPQDPADYKIPAAADRFKDASTNTYTIGRPVPGGQGAGEIPEALKAFYTQKITWGSCEPFGYKADKDHPNIECAYAIAPLDYSNPNGPTIALGMLKVPAKDQAHRIGTLFTDPGGPGAPGMQLAYYGIGRKGDALNRFDLIGFDPRGVGDSLPNLRCESSAAFTAQREGSDTLSGTDLDKILKFNTDQCYANTARGFNGLSGETFIPSVKTPNVAHDLDMMRSIVGDQKLTYLGFSYGTDIGYHYAKLFTKNIRALVLDGQVNPLENNHKLLESPEYAKYWPVKKAESADVAQMRGFNQTFRQFIATCLAEDKSITTVGEQQIPCALADPASPVAQGATPTEQQIDAAYAKYQIIARAAYGTGYYKDSDDNTRPISFQDVTQGTIQAMYSKSLWKYLNVSLRLMELRRDAYLQMRLADDYQDYDPSTGTYGLLQFAFQTISCVDSSQDYSNRQAQQQNSLAQFAVAPFLDPGKNKDGTQRGAEPQFGWCNFYKTRGQATKGEPVNNAPNVLVISSSYDPATPFENGVITAKLLKGTLLAVANASHTAYGKFACSTNITDEYLVDPAAFTKKVKSGYFNESKDPLDTGTTNVLTKDVYSKVIHGNQCQVISFMVDKDQLRTEATSDAKLSQSDYTKESWTAFAAALTKAQAVLSNENAEQMDVDTALKALTAARESLVKVASASSTAPAPTKGEPSKPAPAMGKLEPKPASQAVMIKTVKQDPTKLAKTGAMCGFMTILFAFFLLGAGVVFSLKRAKE